MLNRNCENGVDALVKETAESSKGSLHAAPGAVPHEIQPRFTTLEQSVGVRNAESADERGLFERIIAWEQNRLSESEMLRLFQELVDCDLAWKSTGAVRRTASLLIQNGRIKSEFTF